MKALLIAAAVSGALITGPAVWVKFELFDKPAIIREATLRADDACAIRTMDAANRAEEAERTRQQRVSAEAMRIYQQALDASQRAATAAATQFEQEIADYEAELALAGRSCPLTERDLEWLSEH